VAADAAEREELQRCEAAEAACRATLEARGAESRAAQDALLEAKRINRKAERAADEAVAALSTAVSAREAAQRALRLANGGADCARCGKKGKGDVCKACSKVLCQSAACARPCASCGGVLCAAEGASEDGDDDDAYENDLGCAAVRCDGCGGPICNDLECIAPPGCSCDFSGKPGDDMHTACTGCGAMGDDECKDCGGLTWG
jgi:hypothetical protein